MTAHDRLDPARLDPAFQSLLHRIVGGGHVNRRDLLGGTAAVGAAIALGGRLAPAAGARQATPTGEKGGSGTLVVTTPGDPLSFQPDFQVDDNGFAVCSNLYNSLLSLDGDYNVIPELAERYEAADDGLSITFTLPANAVWHDGEPVTSADVKYSLEMIKNTASATASSLIGALATVETPDPRTAVVTLANPSSSIIGFLAWYGVFILPAHIYEGTDWSTNPANQQPVGSGPFKFVSYTTGSSIELEANLDYFGEGPYLDRLIFQVIPDSNTAFQALLNGEIDAQTGPSMPNAEIANAQGNPDLKVAEKLYPSPYYLGYNNAKPTLSTPEVRRALAMAIDRDQIIATALGGYSSPATTYYPTAIAWAANTEPDAATPPFDVEGAAAALDAAGFPVNGDSRFSLTLLVFTASQQYVDVATVLAQQFAAVDVDVELNAVEIGAYGELIEAGDFDMALIGGFQGPDPGNLRARIGTGGGINYWAYSNPEIDTLLDEGEQLTVQAERAEKYYEIQRLMAADVPYVPLATYIEYTPYGANVTGMWFDNNDPAARSVGLNRFTLARRAE